MAVVSPHGHLAEQYDQPNIYPQRPRVHRHADPVDETGYQGWHSDWQPDADSVDRLDRHLKQTKGALVRPVGCSRIPLSSISVATWIFEKISPDIVTSQIQCG